MVAHTVNPSTQEFKVGEFEFHDSLGYILKHSIYLSIRKQAKIRGVKHNGFYSAIKKKRKP